MLKYDSGKIKVRVYRAVAESKDKLGFSGAAWGEFLRVVVVFLHQDFLITCVTLVPCESSDLHHSFQPS